ncbi:MAG TPA: DUF6544 family protein [Polyangiaceae bacterium]|jgi:hypothetical protein
MWSKLWKEAKARGVFGGRVGEAVTHAELEALPPAARRTFEFFDVCEGTPKHASFRVGWTGRFRLDPDADWMPVQAVQINTRTPIARIFHMKARVKHIVPVLSRDTYVGGHGRMVATVAGLVTLADGRGPEFDRGELVTWLDDAVFFAPTMLLGHEVVFGDAGADAFDLELRDRGVVVRARVTVDDRGAPIDFETSDRYVADPYDPTHALVRARWHMPVDAWRTDGRLIPSRGHATWSLPRGEFEYADFEPVPETLHFDIASRTTGAA